MQVQVKRLQVRVLNHRNMGQFRFYHDVMQVIAQVPMIMLKYLAVMHANPQCSHVRKALLQEVEIELQSLHSPLEASSLRWINK